MNAKLVAMLLPLLIGVLILPVTGLGVDSYHQQRHRRVNTRPYFGLIHQLHRVPIEVGHSTLVSQYKHRY